MSPNPTTDPSLSARLGCQEPERHPMSSPSSAGAEARGLVVDLFAGGGGASVGIEAALGRPVDLAINHDAVALAVHKANHPETRHLEADIWEVRPREATGGQPVDVLWASPDCTHFSVAKGGKPRKQNIRSLAWVVTRWAKEVRPRLIFLENVNEFRTWGPLGPNGQPDKARMGETFRRWLARLEKLGYAVEYRVLDASLYGAPTRRRRLFLIARRDGLPIEWPEVTHGPGKLPLHAAAECIDWSIPCPSIFERERPLAEKTLWRIAQGIRRFVLKNPRPFIVRMAHGQTAPDGSQRRGHGAHAIADPLPTVTGSSGGGGFAVAVPVVAGVGGRAGQSPATPGDAPVGTVTAKNDRVLIVPSLVEMNHSNAPHGADEPLGVVTTQHNRFNAVEAALAPALMKFRGDSAGASLTEPAPTVTAGGHQRPERPATGNPIGLLSPTLVKVNHGKQEPRGESIEEPLSTVTATQRGHALVAPTLLRTDMHQSNAGCTYPPEDPLRTITEPLRTLTAKARLGLVTVEGVEFQIVDIGMRMLEPHELLRAQFGRFAGYDLSAARTKAAKVRLIGNSVCPEVAEALVRANVLAAAEELEATA